MEITEKIVIAIIAALVSVVVSLMTSFLSHGMAKKRYELETKEKWREKLYELRLTYYPQAFEITGRLRFGKDRRPSVEELEDISEDLRDWWVGPAAPLLSKSTVKAYYAFQDDIKTIVKNGEFKGNVINSLFSTDREFRRQLRKDLDLILPLEDE